MFWQNEILLKNMIGEYCFIFLCLPLIDVVLHYSFAGYHCCDTLYVTRHSLFPVSYMLCCTRMQRNKGQFTSSKKSEGAYNWGTLQESGQDDSPQEAS